MKMKEFVVMLLLLAIASGLSCKSSFAAAAPKPKSVEFQAEFLERDHDEITKGKIYIANGMSRYENGTGEIVVTRRDKKVIWLIFPRLSRYVEQEYNIEPTTVFIDPEAPPSDDLTREFIDYEWIDSYRLRKFLVTVKYTQGEDRYYEWFRDNFPVPVKTSSLDGKISFEYQKIKIGPLDPGLFATPKSYKKVKMEEIIEMEKSTSENKKQ